MKALLIDALNRRIVPIEYAGYDDMRVVLPGGITIAWVFHDQGGDVLYVDDEGLLRPPTCAFRLLDRTDGQPLMGNGLLTGRDDAKIVDDDLIETTLDPVLTPKQLAEHVEWLTVEQAIQWFRDHSGVPSGWVDSAEGRTIISHYGDFVPGLTDKPE